MIRLVVVVLSAVGLILFVAFVAARFIKSFKSGISIRLQVFTALAAIVGAFALGLGILVVDRVEARAVRFANEAASGEAHAIARLLAVRSGEQRFRLDELARSLQASDGSGLESAVEIVDAQGALLWQKGSASKDPGSHAAAEASIERDGVEIGRVRVTKPAIAVRRLLEDFAPSVLLVGLILGATAALAAAWIGRAIAHPIEALTRFSESVSEGVEAVPPPPSAAREVRRLGQSIDSMRRQLEGRPFAETFAADLSHELKNPVAAVRASAEVLREGALREPELAPQFVARILEATARIERLLENLLSLAHIEARGVEEFAVVRLDELTRDALAATLDGQRVRLEAPGEFGVRGDADWLKRSIFNLIDNALTHAPAGSMVDVSIRRQGKWVAFRITNPGALDRHVRRELFRRFVTTRRERGGTGLGLALVRAVAEAHRGSVSLVDPGPPEVVFLLLLPAALSGVRDQPKESSGETEGIAPASSRR